MPRTASGTWEQLTTDINNTINAAKMALTTIQANASAAAVSAVVATLAPQVRNLASETKSAISTLTGAGIARAGVQRHRLLPEPGR